MTETCEAADATSLLTCEDAHDLLRITPPPISASAETSRIWSRLHVWLPHDEDFNSVPSRLQNSILLRTYDAKSGSQPDTQADTQGRMLARAPRMRLDTKQVRRDTLEKHANHRIREPTPYISFTSSPRALQDLADRRMRRGTRGDQYIVAVDPQIRLENRLPILHYKDEMEYYSVGDADECLNDQYLCLWEVTPEEVVGVWAWDELRTRSDWFENVVMPEVEEYRVNRLYESGDEETSEEEDWEGSDDSDEKVMDDVWPGQVTKRFEDLSLD